ncbi:hypothetical protein KA119_00480 [Candidatus Gracilibacteria bacterium]|nr:hypothetical protein [Candidatus Gracilibacteria bacterium]
MQKLSHFLVRLLLTSGAILVATKLTALAGSLPPVSPEVFSQNQLPTPPTDQSGQQLLLTVIFSAAGYVKTIVAVLGIGIISYIGYQLVSGGENEDTITNAKKGLTMAVLAFVIISMSEDVAQIFDMSEGTLLQNPQQILQRVHLFDSQVELGITFIKYIIGIVAVLGLVRAGSVFIIGGANEEKQTEARNIIIFTAAAFAIIFAGEIFIDKVFYKVNREIYSGITGVHPQLDAKEGVEQIVGITNFIVSFLGPVGVLALIYGAVLYATSGGEQDQMDKAKRIIVACVIGLVIIYGAFALVSTVIAGRLEDIGAVAT